ncbi:MAG: Spy/CpxP family protein refolding chaperone [Cyanobacteria bacterium]|nr:Spy/CpxP family protein refolding chaperone [Cyanobacteriota bacterium]MDW8201432.1 Spy/CpxP family protein refolding chaperone [Cyanobacteriota bacterium SKYGB_h_bin112]
MRSLPTLTLLLTLLGAATAPFTWAFPGDVPPVVAQRRRGDLLRELNLSPQQTRQIQAIRNRYQGQIEQRKRAVAEAQQQLRSLMSGDASADQLRQQFRQVQAARQELAELHFNSLLEMRAILTPEQRRKFADLVDRRPPLRGGR